MGVTLESPMANTTLELPVAKSSSSGKYDSILGGTDRLWSAHVAVSIILRKKYLVTFSVRFSLFILVSKEVEL